MKLKVAVLALLGSTVAGAQTPVQSASAARPHAIVATPDVIKWGPAPASLPAGAQLAVLEGDPMQSGEFTMRLAMPDGYRIPPHFHPVVEHVTVVEGTFKVGMGEVFDAAKATALPPGTFAALAPGVRHFAFADGRTVIQLHGTGPWRLTYVNPADDPRNKSR